MTVLLNNGYPPPLPLPCSCEASSNFALVHGPGCGWPAASAIPTRWFALEALKPTVLVDPSGKPIHRRDRKNPIKGRVTPKTPQYRMLLQFYFTRPINIKLWKHIKAPPGWRKNPTTKEKQGQYRGVRFQCDDFKHALTPDDVQQLHMRLMLILEESF